MQQLKSGRSPISNLKNKGVLPTPKIDCKLNLSRVNGITSNNNSSIDFNPVNSCLAYITGSIVVIFDTK